MSIFSSILSKLGLSNENKEVSPSAIPPSTAGVTPTSSAQPMAGAIRPVDVAAKLETLASSNAEALNWKTSIVDLMKLLGLDSSLKARRELAEELGCPPDKMNDSGRMNIWLHKTVLKKLSDNGGNISADLLD
ncbi:MAG: DUF3597 domain-containing protein [Methylobacter sp.]|nr:DUF3597 domain-containing protein [Methylobacter sp.]